MDTSSRSTRSESCSNKKYSCRKGIALGLCLFLLVGIFTSFVVAAEDYSYTEYTFDAQLIAAYFESGKITASIASYTTDSGSSTNVQLTNYYIDPTGYIWFYNPSLTNYSDMGDRPSSGNAVFNVYIDFGFSFYFPKQNFNVASIANANTNVNSYTNNSKLNLVRGATAIHSLSSEPTLYYTASYYNSYLTNFSYMYNLINGTTVTNYKNMRHRYRARFAIGEFYGNGSEYYDSLNINYNVVAQNQSTYRVPMIGLQTIKLYILNNPGAPSQDINTVVSQLNDIKDLISDGNSTQAQISSAVSSINQTLTVPTSEQVSIESDAASIAEHEVSDIQAYESMVNEGIGFFESIISDVDTIAWSTDEVMPHDNNWLTPFYNHRIFHIIFACVGVCAVAAFLLHGRW